MAGTPFTIKEATKEKETQLFDKIPVKDKVEKVEADKAHKDAKDNKEAKEAKEKQEKEKQEKEKQEKDGKNETKDLNDKHKHEKENKDQKETHPKERSAKEIVKEANLEKLPETKSGESEAGAAQPSAEPARKLLEKVHKDKVEKIEKEKFEKFEKHEKFEVKELEKFQEGVGGPIGPGPVESRLAALESAVSQLLHFIPENLRPDLSKGALRQEADVGEQKTEPGGAPAAEPGAEGSKKEHEKKK